MKTVQIIQLIAGLIAVAAIAGADAFGLSLGEMSMALLGAIAGWVVKRPSDMLKPKE